MAITQNITNDAERRAIQETQTNVDPRLTFPNNLDTTSRFFKMLKDLITDEEAIEEFPALRGVDFNRFHPAVAPTNPSIIYRVTEQYPARNNVSENTRFSGFSGRSVREMRPRMIQRSRPIPGHPGDVADVWLQRTDANLSFAVFSTQGKSTDEITQDFMDFMYDMAGLFQYSGIERLFWLNEIEPAVPSKWSEELVVREQRYRIRYQRVFFRKTRKLNNIAIRVKRLYATQDSLSELSEEIDRRDDFEDAGMAYPLNEFQAKLDTGGA